VRNFEAPHDGPVGFFLEHADRAFMRALYRSAACHLDFECHPEHIRSTSKSELSHEFTFCRFRTG
jgi:hypothetical protein